MKQEANIEEDPYVYPGTSILRNLAELHDAERLEQFESDHCFARLLELYENPLALQFDLNHLKRIHQHLFQDVYAWAGEFRTVNIAKGSSFFRPAGVHRSGIAESSQSVGERTLSERNRLARVL